LFADFDEAKLASGFAFVGIRPVTLMHSGCSTEEATQLTELEEVPREKGKNH